MPFPLDLADPLVKLALDSSDFLSAVDNQTLRVTDLDPARSYELQIDGAKVATFTGAELSAGVNLAALPTPMLTQAREVYALVKARSDVHNTAWRSVQTPNEKTLSGRSSVTKALKAMDAAERAVAGAVTEAARPRAHRFRVVPSG